MPSRLLPSPTNEPVPDNPYTDAEDEDEDPFVTDVRIGDEEDLVSTGVEEKSKKKRRNKRRKTKKKTEKKTDAVKYSQKAKRNAVPLTPPAPAGAGDKSKDRNLDESAADEEEGETDSHSSVSSTDDRPPVAIHLKPRDGVRSQAAPVAAGRDKSRFVHTPHGSRDDIGSFGVYQGNWGGRRKSVSLRNHIIDDIVVKNPAHILCAQEVDQEFIGVLQDPAIGATPIPKRVYRTKTDAAADVARSQNLKNAVKWHVVYGDEGEGSGDKTCIIAVKESVAAEVELLEWRKIPDGRYKDKKKKWHPAESRILVARVWWKKPMHGKAATVVATAHMHRLTAKKARGFEKAHNVFWRYLHVAMATHAPVVLTRDFNMPHMPLRGLFS